MLRFHEISSMRVSVLICLKNPNFISFRFPMAINILLMHGESHVHKYWAPILLNGVNRVRHGTNKEVILWGSFELFSWNLILCVFLSCRILKLPGAKIVGRCSGAWKNEYQSRLWKTTKACKLGDTAVPCLQRKLHRKHELWRWWRK